MIAKASFLQKRIFKLTSSRHSDLNPLKPTLHLPLPPSRSGFFSGLGSPRISISKTMTELVKASAFSSSDSEENVTMLQQDAFVNQSSPLSSRFLPQGFEPFLNRLSKWLVAFLFGGILLWRHDAEALWVAMGAVLNALLSVTLKRIFNQERPFATSKSDPGMPSSHAQCILYTAVFCSLSVTEWLGVNGFSLTISAVSLALGLYFSWLRVSQQYHTASQVMVGGAVGALFSFLWYWSWRNIVLEAYKSSALVRIVVIAAASTFCLGFLLYVIRHWLKDEE